ncbi:MAG: hypothetical protein A2178_00765 [Planctomycetes bacterium GWC2_49_10]|nr:MAG: hypothetical protein A2178_00765 [Planctomycetes bacterium GWC2_49_10]
MDHALPDASSSGGGEIKYLLKAHFSSPPSDKSICFRLIIPIILQFLTPYIFAWTGGHNLSFSRITNRESEHAAQARGEVRAVLS